MNVNLAYTSAHETPFLLNGAESGQQNKTKQNKTKQNKTKQYTYLFYFVNNLIVGVYIPTGELPGVSVWTQCVRWTHTAFLFSHAILMVIHIPQGSNRGVLYEKDFKDNRRDFGSGNARLQFYQLFIVCVSFIQRAHESALCGR